MRVSAILFFVSFVGFLSIIHQAKSEEVNQCPVGRWQSVDYVENIENFKPGQKSWQRELFLKEVEFRSDGTTNMFFRCENGWILHEDGKTKARFYIRQMVDSRYLFLPWLSGDVTDRGQKPWYYVLRKVSDGPTTASQQAQPKPHGRQFGDTPGKWRGQKLSSLPSYNPDSPNPFKVDLRSYDLSALDLRKSFNDLMHADFDDDTVWPDSNRMLPRFDSNKIMELGKNPGLRIRTLHARGITGKGISIAIIDQKLLKDHQEYADRLKLYEEINANQREGPTMHGAAVSSIAVGETIGVAPEADLYYIASQTGDYDLSSGNFTWNFTYYAKSIDRLLEINNELPPDKKIRVIAMQVGWQAGQKGYEEVISAAQKAKAANILVICSSVEEVHDFRFHGLGRPPLANPDIFESYEPGLWWAKQFYSGNQWKGKDRLMVPMDSRTTANFTGPAKYVFYREGGWSWSIPYIAGLYALAAQVDPNITPDRFWQTAMTTGRTINVIHEGSSFTLGPIANPVALIAALQKNPSRSGEVHKDKTDRTSESSFIAPVRQRRSGR